MKYDYIVVGRARNTDQCNAVAKALRSKGKTVYCFTENSYDGDGIKIHGTNDTNYEAAIKTLENVADWQNNPTFRQVYENDMTALQNAERLVLVFPAGLSAHMELGAAFGMGKKCYGVGAPEKNETLYLMFDRIFPDIETMTKELA
jgi:hypothetical protein